jgi:hypothetical protein
MVIERSANEFIIRMPVISQIERIQELVDYFRYIELTSGSKTPQDEVDSLAKGINRKWHNKHENCC